MHIDYKTANTAWLEEVVYNSKLAEYGIKNCCGKSCLCCDGYPLSLAQKEGYLDHVLLLIHRTPLQIAKLETFLKQ